MNPNVSNYENAHQYNNQKRSLLLEICEPLFSHTEIKNFAYQRFYPEGKHVILFSHSDYPKLFFSAVHDLGKTFFETIAKIPSQQYFFYLWPHTPRDYVFEGMMENNIWNGITVYLKKKSYLEAYYFGATKNDEQIHNFYLNNKHLLRWFILYFQSHLDSLIEWQDSSIYGYHTGEYILTQNALDTKIQETALSEDFFIERTRKIALNVTSSEVKSISKQPFKCLQLLAKGYTIKMIAQSLKISPNTVDTYITQLRAKLDCSTNQLIHIYHENFHDTTL